jgi:hypothetical protein
MDGFSPNTGRRRRICLVPHDRGRIAPRRCEVESDEEVTMDSVTIMLGRSTVVQRPRLPRRAGLIAEGCGLPTY